MVKRLCLQAIPHRIDNPDKFCLGRQRGKLPFVNKCRQKAGGYSQIPKD